MSEYPQDRLTTEYDVGPESDSLGASLLKTAISFGVFQLGAMGIDAATRGIGGKIMSVLGRKTFGDTVRAGISGIAGIAKTHPGLYGSVLKGASTVLTETEKVATAVSGGATFGQAMSGVRRLGPALTRYKRAMAAPRKALADHNLAYPRETVGLLDRARLGGFWKEAGRRNRVIGVTENYAKDYIRQTPGFYLIDRVTGAFDKADSSSPAWYNLPGQALDIVKYGAAFMPMDIAFRGAMKYGAEGIGALGRGISKHVLDAKTRKGQTYRDTIHKGIIRNFGPSAAETPGTISSVLVRAKAAVEGIGGALSAGREPLLLERRKGFKFKLNFNQKAIHRTVGSVQQGFRTAYDASRVRRYTEAAQMKLHGMSTEAFRQLSDLSGMATNMKTNDETTSQLLVDTVGKLGHNRPGLISKALGGLGFSRRGVPLNLDQSTDVGKLVAPIREALVSTGIPEANALKMVLYFNSQFAPRGSSKHDAILDVTKWRPVAATKRALAPLKDMAMGFPFLGVKIPIGHIASYPLNSLLDAISGEHGVLPAIKKLNENEKYILFRDRTAKNYNEIEWDISKKPNDALFEFTSDEPAYIVHGQLYKRRPADSVGKYAYENVLTESGRFWKDGKPTLEWVGIDKGLQGRVARNQAQLQGLLSEDYHLPSQSVNWEPTLMGAKKAAEVGGFARGLFGAVYDLFHNTFTRGRPRHILGDTRHESVWSKIYARLQQNEINPKDFKPEELRFLVEEMSGLYADARVITYKALQQPGVIERFNRMDNRGDVILNFGSEAIPGFRHVVAPDGTLKAPLGSIMELSEQELVDAAKALMRGRRGEFQQYDYRGRAWSKKVNSIVQRYEENPSEGLGMIRTQYPRDLMLFHKSDLTAADELKQFLFFDTLQKEVAGEVRYREFDDFFQSLRKENLIGDKELDVMRFSLLGLRLETEVRKHSPGALKTLLSEAGHPGKKALLEMMSSPDNETIYRNMGRLYGPFAKPRTIDHFKDVGAIGTEQTSWTLLARHKTGMGFFEQMFPKPGNPLTTAGAIPFMIMDRFASVGNYLGFAYDPTKRQSSRDLAGYFGKLALGAGAAIWGYQGLDTFTDVNPLFSNTFLDEGISVALADQYAKARSILAGVYDTTGVTSAARYMEGLMPGSVNSPLSALVRGFVAPVVGAKFGPIGLAVGASISAFTAGGPLALFDEWDLTKSREEINAEFRGEKYIPIRKGKLWEASSDPWAGGRIQYFAPNWYHRLKSQYRYTPTQFGSKLESFLFRDMPLIGFNPIGTMISPYWYEKKHYLSRPYPETAPLFGEVPFIGGLLSSTFGALLKPRIQMHNTEFTSSYINGTGWVPNDLAGVGPTPYNTAQKLLINENKMLNASFVAGADDVGTSLVPGLPLSSNVSITKIIGETFKRSWQTPAGIIGWETFLALGDLPYENSSYRAHAGPITSWTRQYKDANLGGMLGTTEFIRRFMDQEKNIDYVNPLRNQMPSWLQESAKRGDPYSAYAMGELRLPGKGYEAAHNVNFTYPGRASQMGKSYEDQLRYYLGANDPFSVMEEEILESGTQMHRAIQQNLSRMNLLVQAEAPVYDAYNDISGHIDAIVREGAKRKIVEIKTVTTEKLARMTNAQDPHRSQLNFYLSATGLKKGAILYVSRDDPTNMKMYEYGFDPKRLNRDIDRLNAVRGSAEMLRSSGVGNSMEGYSWLDRAGILVDLSPNAQETKEAIDYAMQQVNLGLYGPEGEARLNEILRMRRARLRTYDFYPRRFGSISDIISPGPTEETVILPDGTEETVPIELPVWNENRYMKTAGNYNLAERIIGGVWEAFSHRDTWIHRRFMNTYSPTEHYDQNVLYNRSQSFWDSPLRDFVEPGTRSMLSETTPWGGASSFALTAATFGSNAIGGLAGIIGAAWGTIHGAYRSLTEDRWIPDIIQKEREYSEYFDKLKYMKAINMYNVTGDQEWLTRAGETLTGLQPYDVSGKGWTSFFRSMPFQEKPYVAAFLDETDPDRREEIRERVPLGVRRALDAKWNSWDGVVGQYNSDQERTDSLVNYFNRYHLPRANWMGWHPLANIDDTQIKTYDAQGMDAHDFGLGWLKQRRRMALTPYQVGPLDIYDETGEAVFPEGSFNASQVSKALQDYLKTLGVNGRVSITQSTGEGDVINATMTVTRDNTNVLAQNMGAVALRTI